MKGKMFFGVIVTGVIILSLACVGMVSATPIWPSFAPGFQAAKGESLFLDGYDITVDFIVYEPTFWSPAFTGGTPITTFGSGSYNANTEYLYVYQVENVDYDTTTGASKVPNQAAPLNAITIDFISQYTANSVTAGGHHAVDLDAAVGYNHNLVGEHDSNPSSGIGSWSQDYGMSPGQPEVYVGAFSNITWAFDTVDRLRVGEESAVLWFSSSLPPTYDDAAVIDGAQSPDGRLPSPAPEPTTLLLLGSGLLGMAGYARMKLKRKRG